MHKAKVYVKPVWYRKGYYKITRLENFFEISEWILLKNEDLKELGRRGVEVILIN
jgi:hypothetical protein|tara:strand:+ start:2894 stop:3058 length:165 start_codon:yes stop_codon:yes gene_type:complete